MAQMMAHHRRKEGTPVTTRGAHSRLTSIRLPYSLEEALKAEAEAQSKPWQTLLKDLLIEALGLDQPPDMTDTMKRPATDLHRAMKKLKTR